MQQQLVGLLYPNPEILDESNIADECVQGTLNLVLNSMLCFGWVVAWLSGTKMSS